MGRVIVNTFTNQSAQGCRQGAAHCWQVRIRIIADPSAIIAATEWLSKVVQRSGAASLC